VDLALDYLADAGIGGLKGTGHGAFAYNVWSDAAEFAQPTGGDYFVSLARLAPRPQDLEQTLLAERTAYQLVTVGGWCQDDVAHSWRRRRVRLVTEGAYLNWPGYLPGALVDVTPAQVGRFTNGRRVYRYGLAYPVAAVPPQANTGGTNG
jgi:CRISPR type III-A-associated RAMP protein Csm4